MSDSDFGGAAGATRPGSAFRATRGSADPGGRAGRGDACGKLRSGRQVGATGLDERE